MRSVLNILSSAIPRGSLVRFSTIQPPVQRLPATGAADKMGHERVLSDGEVDPIGDNFRECCGSNLIRWAACRGSRPSPSHGASHGVGSASGTVGSAPVTGAAASQRDTVVGPDGFQVSALTAAVRRSAEPGSIAELDPEECPGTARRRPISLATKSTRIRPARIR